MSAEPAIVPAVFYRDLKGALDWLERAFGFELAFVVTDDAGNIGHSEMAYGDGRFAVGAEWQDAAIVGGARMRSPASQDGVNTQFLRVHLHEDLDAHHERARAAGARITDPPKDQFYGQRTYRALDLEGHVWTFSRAV